MNCMGKLVSLMTDNEWWKEIFISKENYIKELDDRTCVIDGSLLLNTLFKNDK